MYKSVKLGFQFTLLSNITFPALIHFTIRFESSSNVQETVVKFTFSLI